MIPYKVFVSYSMRSGEISIEMLRAFQYQLPLNCDAYIDILDNDSINKQERVNYELENCDSVIHLYSAHSSNSPWVSYELDMAKRLGKRIIEINVNTIQQEMNFMNKHKVFISYHHKNDQWAKDRLIELNNKYNIFIDKSVDTGDITDDLDDQTIRIKIRDEYLRDSTVTILLVGTETMNRKFIDWELYSSMFDGVKNKRSGIVVIMLPSTDCQYFHIGFENEKQEIFPSFNDWHTLENRKDYEERYPYLPERIIDNLLKKEVKMSIVRWEDINIQTLSLLIDNASNNRFNNQYDLSRNMKRNNGFRVIG